MNDRIFELANQVLPRETELHQGDPKEYAYFFASHELVQFAELIVKECLGDLKERIALRYQGDQKDRDIGYGMEIVYLDIVDNFGVE
jgi:hypothetical protein